MNARDTSSKAQERLLLPANDPKPLADHIPVEAMRSALRDRPNDTLALKDMRAKIKARRLVR